MMRTRISSLAWLCAALALGGVAQAWAVGVDVGPEWLFETKDDEKELLQWGAINQLAPLDIDQVTDAKKNKRGVLLTESLGGDPYMFPGGNWNVADYEPFNGKKNKTLYMGLRVNMANTWQIYYVTTKDGAWGEVMRQNFDVAMAADFQDIEVVLERGGWQDSDIKGFRIDPGTAAGVKAEIDYISFVGRPEGAKAVDPVGRSAVAWGALKAER